jgi:hypothetical protein
LNIYEKVVQEAHKWILGYKYRDRYFLVNQNDQDSSIEAGSSAKLDGIEQALKKKGFPF